MVDVSLHTARIEPRHFDSVIARCFGSKLDEPAPVGLISSQPGEGVTTLTVNLGLALAERYSRRVILVEGNLARPAFDAVFFGDVFRTEPRPGLVNVIQGDVLLDDCVVTTGNSGLSILTGGHTALAPAVALDDPRLGIVMSQLRDRFDAVIFDCPSIDRIGDAMLLVKQLHSLILVMTSEGTTRGVARRSIGELEVLGRPPVGVIINRCQSYLPHMIERRL